MLREVRQDEYSIVYELIKKDSARNYFLRLGFESDKPVYERIIGEWDESGQLKAVLLKRLSGNLQFYAKGDFDIEGFADNISAMKFDSLISPRSYCDRLLNKGIFSDVIEGAIIAKLDCSEGGELKGCSEVELLKLEDLDEVVRLYENVFTAFSSKAVMQKRLRSGRGRGVCIRHEGRIVSVVQSEFEENDSALIVGVGTAPEFQGKGLATQCLKSLCGQLLDEGKDLYLQYDNMDAGRIYEKLGFKPMDQIRHYKR
ncbi:MAG TPA: GNAT family N-acetyltransferase [Patescibacteria group bacterium]|nr:GNAT family N-acetyltransferase [Patescibacteria group bacterium]